MPKQSSQFSPGEGIGGLPAKVVYRLCHSPELSDRERRVAMAMLSHTSMNSPRMHAGQRRIAQLARVHQPDVPGLIRGLEEAGVLRLLKQGTGSRTSVYEFIGWPEVDEDHDPPHDLDDAEPKPRKPSNPGPSKPAPPDDDSAEARYIRELRALLEAEGVKGKRLDQAAANEHLSLRAVKDLIDQSKGKKNPAAWLASACIGYQPASADPSLEDVLGTSGGMTQERWDAMQAAKMGISMWVYDEYQERGPKLYEQIKAEHPDMPDDQIKVQYMDPLIEQLKQEEQGNG